MALMHELRRLVYLEALGIDGYVSRSQVPGAAVTRRLAILPATQTVTPQGRESAAKQHRPAAPIEMPRVEAGSLAPVARVVEPAQARQHPTLNFSLAAVTCGGWLWVEELDGVPFTPAQSQLVQSMADALGRFKGSAEAGSRPAPGAVLTQFDWPMHTNLQLDQGQEAALSSVAAFIRRKLEQAECTGLVLLGRECEARVPLDQLDSCRIVRTVSTARMLREPLLKRQAWQDLGPFCRLS